MNEWRHIRDRDLPTYRQIDYWIRCGNITPSKNPTGSGSRRVWSDHEVDKLEALARLSRAFDEFGVTQGLPGELVAEIWEGLDESEMHVISFGNPEDVRLRIRIEVSV